MHKGVEVFLLAGHEGLGRHGRAIGAQDIAAEPQDCDEQKEQRTKPEREGVDLQGRLKKHKIAVASDDEADGLGIGITRAQTLADQDAKVVRKGRV